ncbi:M23 family metallopeptidase [Magnetospirillum sp. SS-4]|uniref:M23 family metallopeptidase n=1 Tax=Magnetospirillum sp. SS-4 TaxID=2681465 RepID=UPI00138233B7|nr:M23 family metallopeptidase [Magnetospirillum sp. SS-4]CAA7615972.1 Membrane protein related to metalloendopeptidase [Magnetospirillum sp. SS-4]
MPASCGRRNSLIVPLLLVLLGSPPVRADTTLVGRLEQGGLVQGRTGPGASVTLDGRAVPVSADGRFLLGFGRDAEAEAMLEVQEPGQAVQRRPLVIARRDWAVQRIEGLPRDKADPDPVAVARIKEESDRLRALRNSASPVPLFLSGLIRPADGTVSGVFGSQRVYNGRAGAPHSGLDIAAPTGAPVWAAADGVVVLAAPDLFLTGRTVMIDHGLGLMSSYAHLSRIDVTAGSRVAAGQPIGAIGATGLATGAHLHWGMSWMDIRLDPQSTLGVLGGISAQK